MHTPHGLCFYYLGLSQGYLCISYALDCSLVTHTLHTPSGFSTLIHSPLMLSHLGSKGRRAFTVECSGSSTPSKDARSVSLIWRRCSSEGEGVKCSGRAEGAKPCALLEGCTPFTPPAAAAAQSALAWI